MHAPLFWKYRNRISDVLLPVAAIYRFFAERRQRNTTPETLPIPVICIGNMIAGGAGKTPVALAVGKMLSAQGINAHFLSRGYKGKLAGPVRVDPLTHSAEDVGDEPLLLAEVLPTWIAKDRVAGAKAALEAGAQVIIMDDGFQNPSITKTLSLLVIDGSYGFGNERIFPAGPMRETIEAGLARAHGVVLIGDDQDNVLRHVPPSMPVIRAELLPLAEAYALSGQKLIAFAGIARPRKFYRTLQALDCTVKNMVAYPDHYTFKEKDLRFLRERAEESSATLVTTAKDYVRLKPEQRIGIVKVEIEASFEDTTLLSQLLDRALGSHAL